MSKHTIGTHDEWLAARLALLERERELTHLSDKLAEQRRELPWVAVEKDYCFDTEEGPLRNNRTINNEKPSNRHNKSCNMREEK
jgi:predicted dithiol-disulfide oxidoreductase (DUF899 family)